MSTPTATLFFSFLLLPLAYCAPPPATPTTGPCPSLDGHTQFIRSRCNLTHYPDLCFASLSSYAAAVSGSLPELARVAANLTLARIRTFRTYVSALRRAGGDAALGRTAAALRDCAEQLGDAADQVCRTSNELRGVEALVGMEVSWRVSNAQTWMSAALTYEESCSDGFHEVAAASSVGSGGGDSGIDVKTDICRRVMRVKQYTSNALALVNSLVDGR
ncbi:21 kDa protein-like [Curcuma longa]|uniref:21 kDa protein-like n=1 Tax=Curcuma longa TaxID=136217 RepID=UPI003D9F0B48